jgi:hypothetical protein
LQNVPDLHNEATPEAPKTVAPSDVYLWIDAYICHALFTKNAVLVNLKE